jgi:hypothetical protein
MGYTHYYPQQKECPLDQWAMLKADVLRLFDARPDVFETAGYTFNAPLVLCTGDGEEVLKEASELFQVFNGETGETLCFNGDGSEGLDHETMLLTQHLTPGFQFCKTARKPYDWFAVACLLLAEKHCPGCFKVSSDGDPEEWQPVLVWLEAHGYGALKLPDEVSGK